jgi:acyl dehydratase
LSQSQQFAIGEVYKFSKGPITTTQLVKYAGVSGDFNRIHFDHPFAIQSGLRGVLAHGMLTMGFAASCLTEMSGPQAFITEMSGRFLAPVYAGDVVDVTATVRSRSADGAMNVELEAAVRGKAVLRGTASVIYQQATAAGAS